MKKIFYLVLSLSFVFTSCDPMEDIHNDIDAQKQVITGEAKITLSDDDYDDLGLSFGNFNSIDDAKSMVPGLLIDKYPVWGNGSLAEVTFKWYNKIDTYSGAVYTLSSEEHNEVTGGTFGNFDRDYHITDFLEEKYPNPDEGDFHSLKYKFYAGSVTTLTDGFYFENGEWIRVTGFTPAQYNTMGNGYPNFGSHDEAESKLAIALLDKYKYSPRSAGDIVSTMYELFSGGTTTSYTANYIFDGAEFSKYNNVANETVKFGHDGTTWVPDNTIKYVLTSADYTLVGNGFYGNFDVRPGKAEETIEVRLEKINTILLNNFPGMSEGQKFAVSYNVYSGIDEVYETKVILEGGAYVLQ